MRFQDIPGQRDLANRFVQLHKTNRFPHTLLLSGKSGYGTLALALGIAQYINCTDQGEDSCGVCKSCQLASGLKHPDIHFTFPIYSLKSEGKQTSNDFLSDWRTKIAEHPYFDITEWMIGIGGDNKQANIPAKEISHINAKMSMKSFGSGHKVLIIWGAEYLGAEGNKLLKLIEEPPAQTTIVLIAEDTERILTTILSRCQQFVVPRVEDEAISSFLTQGNYEASDIDSIVRIANGQLNEAIRMTSNVEEPIYLNFRNWMLACLKNNSIEKVKYVEQNAKMGRESQKAFVNYALHFFGEYAKYFAIGDANMLRLTDQEKESVRKLSNVLGYEGMVKVVDQLEHMLKGIGHNAHWGMLLMSATVKLSLYFKESNQSLAAHAR